MSADNGIYIAEFPTEDGSSEFRVISAGAIENIRYFPLGSAQEAAEIISYFGDAIAVDSVHKAREVAFAMAREDYTEYGVRELGKFPLSIETYRKLRVSNDHS